MSKQAGTEKNQVVGFITMFHNISLDQTDAIWILSINRPQALNALNSDVLKELSEAFNLIENSFPEKCRAVILTGSGEKAFVAGADIMEMKDLSAADAKIFAERGQKVFQQIERLSVPVLAAVNGFALGGGLELALSCDFIFASEKSKMGLPEVSLGLIPGFGGTHRLARVIGVNRAREIIFSGQMLTANEAMQIQLVNKVFAPENLLQESKDFLKKVIQQAPIAIRNAKKTILRSGELDIDSALKLEAESFSELFNTQDMNEGTTAFSEKRKAQFLGK